MGAALLMGITHQAAAYDAVADVRITQIELTYMPEHIIFWADRAVGSCPAGAMLDWVPRNSTGRVRTRMHRLCSPPDDRPGQRHPYAAVCHQYRLQVGIYLPAVISYE
jgi:hypothetical protein